jgi:hypothetical protein
MILDAVREFFAARERIQRGNPTGSRWGKCAAQLQMLLAPGLTHPTPLPFRSRLVMEHGGLIEDWIGERIEASYPGASGLTQSTWYLPVPLAQAEWERLAARILAGVQWGEVVPHFTPPSITWDRARDRHRIRYAGTRSRGFLLDRSRLVVWAPVHIDRLLLVPGRTRPLVIEVKSLSTVGFRRALLGDFGYAERMQLAGIAEATGCDVLWLLFRKDTAHLLEVHYVREDPTRPTIVTVTRTNGQVDRFRVDATQAVWLREDDTTVPLDEMTWDEAQVWTPHQPETLDAIRERIRRVLLFDAEGQLPADAEPAAVTALPWDREYGPDFRCPKCAATGLRTCGRCKGSGLTPTGKVHKACAGRGTLICKDCGGEGSKAEALLSFPCTYCPVVRTCYPMATLELTDRPYWTIQRAAWLASGLSYKPVEPPPVLVAAPAEPETPEGEA